MIPFYLRQLLLACLLLLIGDQVAPAFAAREGGVNIVPNGGFEEGTALKPVQWEPHPRSGRCDWDIEDKHSGRRSIQVTNQKTGTSSWDSSLIRSEAGSVIQVRAWMKIRDVKVGVKPWHNAGVKIEVKNQISFEFHHFDLVRQEGTRDWTLYKKQFILPPGTTYIQVACFLQGSTGTAWFDDIEVIDLGKFIGHKVSDNPGPQRVSIACDTGNVIGQISRVNGIYYHLKHGKFKSIIGAKPSIIRLGPLYHYKIVEKDSEGRLRFNWIHLDSDIQKILAVGAIPYINLSFVPDEMEKEVAKRDYTNWERFIYDMVKHYSSSHDVSGWYWSFWNEPKAFRASKKGRVNWDGDENDFFYFYKITANAAVDANPRIKIGGCGFISDDWLRGFVERCGQEQVRLDFLSWHRYGVIPYEFFTEIRRNRQLLDSYPHLKNSELIIDEWSSYGGHEPKEYYLKRSNYAAAYRVASIYYMLNAGLKHNLWFNANSPEFGIEVDGVKQPTYNSFILMGMMGSEEIQVDIPSKDPYVGAIASKGKDGAVSVLVWYFKYIADHNTDTMKEIELSLNGLNVKHVKYQRYLIDKDHGNGFSDPKRQELEVIDRGVASDIKDKYHLNFALSPNSVSMIVVTPIYQ